MPEKVYDAVMLMLFIAKLCLYFVCKYAGLITLHTTYINEVTNAKQFIKFGPGMFQ